MKNLISPQSLALQLSDPLLLVVDCRFTLDQPGLGREQYLTGHVPGAVYISLNEDLSAPASEHGGRHPLPGVTEMSGLFSRLGIVRGQTRVVAYDDGGGAYAARLWWMLRYLGHDAVRILDGGLAAFLRLGLPLSTEPPFREPAAFIPEVRPDMLVPMSDVADIARRGRLIDARAPERFAGETESIDIKAGHIPGAINRYWMNTLDAQGFFLPAERLNELFADVPDDVVMQCGSGVTACVNVLAMEEAGRSLPRLYAGSWSDWISYPEHPIATCRE